MTHFEAFQSRICEYHSSTVLLQSRLHADIIIEGQVLQRAGAELSDCTWVSCSRQVVGTQLSAHRPKSYQASEDPEGGSCHWIMSR